MSDLSYQSNHSAIHPSVTFRGKSWGQPIPRPWNVWFDVCSGESSGLCLFRSALGISILLSKIHLPRGKKQKRQRPAISEAVLIHPRIFGGNECRSPCTLTQPFSGNNKHGPRALGIPWS